MALDDAIVNWQQQLEAVRAAFECDWLDDDDRNRALEDLGKARDWVEIEWLEQQLAAGDGKPVIAAEERQGANSRPEPPETIGRTTDDDAGVW